MKTDEIGSIVRLGCGEYRHRLFRPEPGVNLVQVNGKDIELGGASPGQQALTAGLCDEILIHLAPHLLGDGVRLFDHLGGPVRLEKISVADGPLATHVRYRVLKA